MRKFANKKRNQPKKKPRPLLILVAEGTNVTEQQYFNQFKSRECPYSIIFHKAGHVTDPSGLKASIEKRWEDEGGSREDGDLCYAIVDLDCDAGKAERIKMLQNETAVAEFIVSNPCFEIWFLLHFQYTTHVFPSGKDVVRELRKHISGYKKDMDVYPALEALIPAAITNSKKLIEHFKEAQCARPDVRRNPWTDVWILAEYLRKSGGRS